MLSSVHTHTHTRMHTHTHNRFTALLDFVKDYLGEPAPERENQSGFTGAKDSEWQWHQLGHKQICTLTQTHNHASIPPLSFLQVRCPSYGPTNSVKALKAVPLIHLHLMIMALYKMFLLTSLTVHHSHL